MIRGTTPTLKFNLPFAASLVEACYVTLSQSGRVVVEKTTEDCIASGNAILCKLTQRETLWLSHKKNVDIQLRVKTKNGDVYTSDIYTQPVEQPLKDGEI